MSDATIGIDISKDRLDVHRFPAGDEKAFANDRSGLTALLRWLGSGPVTRVVFEPTGRYHRNLERRLGDAGHALVKVNPRHAKRFCEALGVRAKTDRADAAMLARMGAALALEPQPVRPEILNELNELIAARRALVKDRTAAKNRAKGMRLAILRRQNAARLSRIGADLAAIDKAITVLIAADPALAERPATLLSIPGRLRRHGCCAHRTGSGTRHPRSASDRSTGRSRSVVNGFLNQWRNHSRPRQSGNWRGRSFIQGGRALLREALYMPALVAIRFNPDLKRTYHRLQGNGKPAKVAITAVMRKLIILANANGRRKLLEPRRIL